MKEQKGERKDKAGPQKQQEAASGAGRQYGEGNYKAARQYNEGLKDHVEHHDIEKEARDAAPRSADEEREMEEAERIGKAPSRGEDQDSPDEGKTK